MKLSEASFETESVYKEGFDVPVSDYAIPPWFDERDDHVYTERIGRGVYGMYSRAGNAAVQAARALGQAATSEDVRAVLQARMSDVEQRFDEANDSEVWLHLTAAFEDILVHRSPEVLSLAPDGHEEFIQIPGVAQPPAPMPEPMA